jgi:hypothetical protein
MTTRFVEKFKQDHDVKNILACWWVEDKIFFSKNDGLYIMKNLRDPYIYAMDLMCRLYGEEKYIHFKDAWVPFFYILITNGFVFNWAAILSHVMKSFIERDKKPIIEILPTFYMASYLLDIVCARNYFS